jgi:hypothetical protein
LDEAIGLHQSGSLTKSFDLALLVSGLCQRLTGTLISTLRSLEEHSKHHRTIPSVKPLDPAEFRSRYGQRSALASFLWNRALCSKHAQFLSKLRALTALVVHLGENICAAAQELASDGAALDSASLWSTISTQYFDLNTCLREALISLKCFLRVVPDDEMPYFEKTMSSHRTTSNMSPANTGIPISGGWGRPRLKPSPARSRTHGANSKLA